MRIAKSLTVTTAAGLLLALAAWGEPVKNWPVSATTWTPPASPTNSKTKELAVQAAPAAQPTPPLPFIGITPCRMIDTRLSSMPPGYGVPIMAAGEVRTFAMIGQNHCTLPPEAKAVSLNVTAVNEATDGYVTVYPAGVPTPLVATVVFLHGQTTLNAAIVPLGDGGGLAVKASTGLHLVIDVNGYFAPLTGGTQGPQGPMGPQGPAGPQGPQGPSGMQVPQKMCSVLNAPYWRTDINVPSTWTAATCASFKTAVGGTVYHLTCVFGNSFSFGAFNGGIPPQNCGW